MSAPTRTGSMTEPQEVVPEPTQTPDPAPVTEPSPPEEISEPETDEVEDEDTGYDSRKMSDDTEVWPGGPTFKDINAWKDQHGDNAIYVTEVAPQQYVVWRTMTRFEYRRLMHNQEQAISTGAVSQHQASLDHEEAIAELVILYPSYSRQNSAKELAGVAATIAQQSMEASGFVSLEVRQL